MTVTARSMAAGRYSNWTRAERLHPDPQARGRDRANWKQCGPLKWQSETPPPTRPHLLILPKQLHQLGSKDSNIWAYGGLSHSSHLSYDVRRHHILQNCKCSVLEKWLHCSHNLSLNVPQNIVHLKKCTLYFWKLNKRCTLSLKDTYSRSLALNVRVRTW